MKEQKITSTGKYYTGERHTQILISLMKAHGIRKVVASPGTTNISLVASIQNDDYFQIWSSVDERSAAYIACGLAAESGEPVALTCTGATASRNYVSGLTEAFYRKLPVLAITSTQRLGKVGQYVPQVLDRSVQMKDMVNHSLQCTIVHDDTEANLMTVALNNALLELRKDGGGPVHINLETEYSNDFSCRELPLTRVIKRYTFEDKLPEITAGKVLIYVGSHAPFSKELGDAVDEFCEKYNGLVAVDHASGYRGKYHVMCDLMSTQGKAYNDLFKPELMIHIGTVSGSSAIFAPKTTWRVNPDGIVRDTFGNLEAVFQMEELTFFNAYNRLKEDTGRTNFWETWSKEEKHLSAMLNLDEIPFSNIWTAGVLSKKLPAGCALHLGILNSLRSWNFFEVDESINGYSNTGGFGIDGVMSTLIGASLANPQKLYFGVLGDLAFFYDLNSLGNHNVGENLRILLINNGVGTEFKNYNHRAAQFGEAADAFMAARGHFGNKSPELVRHYAESLGLKYLCASDKKEFLANADEFINPEVGNQSIIFEVFTDSINESEALKIVSNFENDATSSMKNLAKSILGEKGIAFVKNHMR